MIKKIIAVKNVGRFIDSSMPGNTTFAKHTLILGGNGHGKTTLCAVLRSLKTRRPEYIQGRKTLGVQQSASVKILWKNNNNVQFEGDRWSEIRPEIEIYDDLFISENIHAGESVDTNQKRKLSRVIIGEGGVRLAEEETSLATASRAKTSELTEIEKSIKKHLPSGMSLDNFTSLSPIDDIDKQIENLESIVSAFKDASNIASRPLLAELDLPTIPEDFHRLLGTTIDDIGRDVERIVNDHLAMHEMKDEGADWIVKGLAHVNNDSCPFCGQNIEGVSLIAAYKAVFSERYRSVYSDISSMKNRINESFGKLYLSRLETSSEKHSNGIEFWKKCCDFDENSIQYPRDLPISISNLSHAVISLLDKKERNPLERISVDDSFTEALADYESMKERVDRLNESIRNVNHSASLKKHDVGSSSSQVAQTELTRLKAVKIRYSEEVSNLCNDYSRVRDEKNDLDDRKKNVRKQLEEHNNITVKPYELKINEYLDAFNADFTIAETKITYPGGTASSSYHLIINKHKVNLGDEKSALDQPSFKNTLSAGDRSALALAFFLAHIESDDRLSEKIVVFDDPFNSQDAFRRRRTIINILNIARQCTQIIVLSHDATFLKEIWENCPSEERTSLKIADQRANGSKITHIDIEKECQGRTKSDISDLMKYCDNCEGNPVDIIRKIRVVLETYLRTTYPLCFSETDTLGDIVYKIQSCKDDHPLRSQYQELKNINDYTKKYHHGENLNNVTQDRIDSTELLGFVKQTLKIVNATQA